MAQTLTGGSSVAHNQSLANNNHHTIIVDENVRISLRRDFLNAHCVCLTVFDVRLTHAANTHTRPSPLFLHVVGYKVTHTHIQVTDGVLNVDVAQPAPPP